MLPKLALLIALSLTVAACSSVSMSVNSVPGRAKVFIHPVGAGEAMPVGFTPLVLTKQQLTNAGAKSGPIIVEVQKDDYIPERVLVTETSSVDMKLNFALRRVESEQGLSAKNSIDDAQSLNLAIDRLFEVRRFISLESYDEALKHLAYIEQTWPFLSATYELKGGIFFLQKKYRDALAAYSMSLKYNPRSVPSAQMRESLEQQLGISGDELVREYEVKRIPAGELKKAREQQGVRARPNGSPAQPGVSPAQPGAAPGVKPHFGGAMPDLPATVAPKKTPSNSSLEDDL